MRRVFVVLSARYIEESLRTELGRIPTSFVPLANKRAYQRQIEAIRQCDSSNHIVLTVPTDYLLSHFDKLWLDRMNIELVKVDTFYSIGEEILRSINLLNDTYSHFVFHDGRCLNLQTPIHNDSFGLIDTDLEPELPTLTYGLKSDIIWGGLSSISCSDRFAECLINNNYDLIKAAREYSFSVDTVKFNLQSCHLISNARSYFHTRSVFTTERAFNKLSIEHNVLHKYSEDLLKVRSESEWYKDTPNQLKRFQPNYFGNSVDDTGRFFYSIEYLALFPLSDIFVFGRQTVVFWQRIFDRISFFFDAASRHGETTCKVSASIFALLVEKAERRLFEFSNGSELDLDDPLIFNGKVVPSVWEIFNVISRHAVALRDIHGFVHGDLCFSNILYDSRFSTIKLIDPRGVDECGDLMIFGSQIYDVVKLSHSVIGQYDHIIAGLYELEVKDCSFSFRVYSDPNLEEIQGLFRDHVFLPTLCTRSIEVLLPLLFFAMLPLHSESRQRQLALLANAIRLYTESSLYTYSKSF